jgi:hypothetical protein
MTDLVMIAFVEIISNLLIVTQFYAQAFLLADPFWLQKVTTSLRTALF